MGGPPGDTTTTLRSAVIRANGLPKPQGSKRALGPGVMVEQAGAPLKTWREDVKAAAHQVFQDRLGGQPLQGSLDVSVVFYLPRPKGHFRSGASSHLLKPTAPSWPSKRPDLDKLLRGLLDAITTSGVYGDDSQVITVWATKRYSTPRQLPGASVVISEMKEEPS